MPILLLFISVTALSQSGIWIRYSKLDPAAIGFWRMFLASLILVPVVVWRKQLPQLNRKRATHLFLCGTILFVHFYLWFASVQKTVVANAMILFTLNPLFTAIGAWIFFRERVKPRYLFSLLFGFTGVVWLMRESVQFRPELVQGDILAFLCTIAFSAYVLSGKYLRNQMDNSPMALGVYAVCGAWFTLAMLVLKVPFSGYGTNGWIGLAGLTIGSTFLGHFLLTYLVNFLNVNLMSCTTLVEPLLTAAAAYYFFSEPITSAAMVGFALITTSVLILYLPTPKTIALEAKPE